MKYKEDRLHSYLMLRQADPQNPLSNNVLLFSAGYKFITTTTDGVEKEKEGDYIRDMSQFYVGTLWSIAMIDMFFRLKDVQIHSSMKNEGFDGKVYRLSLSYQF